MYEDLKDEHLLSENSDTSEKIDLYEISSDLLRGKKVKPNFGFTI